VIGSAVTGALTRLREAADQARAGWIPTHWERVDGPGRDAYGMAAMNVLRPLGAFDPVLELEPASCLTLECDLDVPAEIAGVSTKGDELRLMLWNIFPTSLFHVGDDGAVRTLLADDVAPAACGPALVTVVPDLTGHGDGRLRVEVRTFPTQVYRQWNWMGFTTPALEARFEALDVAWSQLYLADALATGPCERNAVEEAAALVPEVCVTPDGEGLEAALGEMAIALAPIAPRVEALGVHLIGHSHIDMNWLWTWSDTVEVVRRDIRSVLGLMDEFPEMRFTHSQPATYEIMREHEPELFERVREHILTGRWEPATIQWVEGDTNMAASESTARQMLEAVTYTREQLGAEPTVLLAPDTFGHAGNLPQIAVSAGARVYFHCRANPGFATGEMWPAYWWEGDDGTRILAVTTHGYAGFITAGDLARAALDRGQRKGLPCAAYVYGVGDHGGGPTRESLEARSRFAATPGLPRAICSTLGAYAAEIVASGAVLPVARGESETTFEGCYTTHADTKRFNREGENLLQTADALTAMAGVERGAELDEAWRTVLFHQFHDIFDGSAIAEVYRDQAVDHRKVVAAAAAATDSALDVLHGGLPAGAVAVTNPLGWSRTEPVLVEGLTIEGDIVFEDLDGAVLHGQRDASGRGVWFVPSLPAFSTRSWRARDARPDEPEAALTLTKVGPHGDRSWMTVQTPFFTAKVRGESGIITSLVDRRTGRDLVHRGLVDFRPELALGVFQLLDERPHDMSSWDLREVHCERSLLSGADVEVIEEGPVRVVVKVVHRVRSSTITETITFLRDLPRIDFAVSIDWQEPGNPDVGVPDLKVAFTGDVRRPQAWFETPFGATERSANGAEVPALRWAAVAGDDGGLALLNDCKHGHDVLGSRLRLTLVRTAYDPDAASDIGRHEVAFSLVPLVGDWRDGALAQQAAGFNQPMLTRIVQGDRVGEPPRWRPVVDAGPVVVSALKPARRGRGCVLRLYESTGRPATTVLRALEAGAAVWEVTVLEDLVGRLPVEDGDVQLAFRPWQVRTLLIENPDTPI